MLSQSCFVNSLIIGVFFEGANRFFFWHTLSCRKYQKRLKKRQVANLKNKGLAFRLSLSFRFTTQLLIKAQRLFR